MNLWEVVVTIFVLAISIPSIALEESNIAGSLGYTTTRTKDALVAASAVDEWFAEQALPATIQEGGTTYALSVTRQSGTVCAAHIIQISSSTGASEVAIPVCDERLFTT